MSNVCHSKLMMKHLSLSFSISLYVCMYVCVFVKMSVTDLYFADIQS